MNESRTPHEECCQLVKNGSRNSSPDTEKIERQLQGKRMSDENNRLQTFLQPEITQSNQEWMLNNNSYANAGYHYIPGNASSGGSIKCYACDLEHSDMDTYLIPWAWHIYHNKDCDHLKLYYDSSKLSAIQKYVQDKVNSKAQYQTMFVCPHKYHPDQPRDYRSSCGMSNGDEYTDVHEHASTDENSRECKAMEGHHAIYRDLLDLLRGPHLAGVSVKRDAILLKTLEVQQP